MKYLTVFLGFICGVANADNALVSQNGQSWPNGTTQVLTQGTNGGVYVQGIPGGGGNALPISGTVSTAPATPPSSGPTNITSTQCSTITTLTGQGTTSVLVTGTWTGTLTASKSTNGTTFTNTTATPQPVGSAVASVNVTANGTYTLNTAGMQAVRVCGNTVGSGTAVVTLNAGTASETAVDTLDALTGTAGSPAAPTISVQGISGGTNLPVSQATAANLNATVVGTGTFATQSTLQAGSAIAGKFGIDQTTPGTTNGVQVNAALPAGTNVIGHVIHDSGSTTVVTGNVTVVQPTGTNLHAVLDTTSTTAVTQATAANLNATVVNAGTFAVQNTPSAPAAAAILDGRLQFTSTTAATTLITIPAGKTWSGTLSANVSCQTAAASATACNAVAAFTTTGAGTTPAAGAIYDCAATSGANAATGTVGSQASSTCTMTFPVYVNCASGTCTIAVASTNAGTASTVNVAAFGFTQ